MQTRRKTHGFSILLKLWPAASGWPALAGWLRLAGWLALAGWLMCSCSGDLYFMISHFGNTN